MLDNSEEEQQNEWLKQDLFKRAQTVNKREDFAIYNQPDDTIKRAVTAMKKVDFSVDRSKTSAPKKSKFAPTTTNAPTHSTGNSIKNAEQCGPTESIDTERRDENELYFNRPYTGVVLQAAVVRDITTPAIELDDL